MASRRCPHVIDCPCDETGLLNLSSEDPDPLIFTGIGYTPAVAYRPTTLGPVDSFAIAQDCYGVAFSVASQQIADLLAEINAIACQIGGDGSGGSPVDPTPVSGSAGRSTKGGGGGGGGGGGEPKRAAPTPGGRVTPLIPLHAWSCEEEDLVPAENVYTVQNSRAGVDYLFSISSGALPPGIILRKISLNSAALTGAAGFGDIGKYTFTVLAEVAGVQPGTRFVVGSIEDTFEVYGIQNKEDSPIIQRGDFYVFQLIAYGTDPLTFTLDSGELPDGITLDSDGLISGIVEDAECGKTFNPIIAYADANGKGCLGEVELVVEGLIFTNAQPPDGTLCAAYGPFQFTTDPPATSFAGSTVPCGLTLDTATGIVTGTLKTTDGVFNMKATAAGPTYDAECEGEEIYNIDVVNPTPGCMNQIQDLDWFDFLHVGNATSTMNGGSGVLRAIGEPFVGAACGGGGPSVIEVTSSPLRNCGAAYSANLHVEWFVNDVTCVQTVFPFGTAHTYGQIRAASSAGFFATWTLNFSIAVGVYAGTHDIPFNVPAGLGCGTDAFTLKVQTNGPGLIEAHFTITPPTNPADC